MKTTYLSLLMLAGTLVGARSETPASEINPALLYYQAFLLAPDPMSEMDRNYLWSKKGKEQALPERFGQIVASYDNQFELVRKAACATVRCDWGIDISVTGAGPNTMLPYLARAKAISQTAQLRAVWALQHGRPDEARENLQAAFVLGRAVASDDLLLGSWVQFAIEALDYGTIANHFGEFPPETLKQLVAGFDGAPAVHTMAACVPMEKHGLYDWALHKILELQKTYPNDDAKVMAGFRESGYGAVAEFAGDTNFWPRLTVACGGTCEGLLKLLRETEPLFARLATVLALPQPEYEVQLKQLMADSRKSQNPFVTGYLLAWEKAHFRLKEFSSQAQLAMVHAAVEYKLHGESGLKSVTDPFGNGPFAFQRFVFKGVDRGFELKSAYAGDEAPLVLIFVEKQGAAFQVIGGKAVAQ